MKSSTIEQAHAARHLTRTSPVNLPGSPNEAATEIARRVQGGTLRHLWTSIPALLRHPRQAPDGGEWPLGLGSV